MSAKSSEKKSSPHLHLPLPETVLKHHSAVLKPWMEQCLLQNKVPPVTLFSGPMGTGLDSIAHYLAQWLLCENKSQTPCLKCPNCLRALKGQWLDFTEIKVSDEDLESTGSLKIDQLRPLKNALGFGAYSGSYKITLIHPAERMTPQAANSLLKILEEPPPGWVFFLTTADVTLLLPTLVSRCQVLKFKPFPPELLLDLLEQENIPPERKILCSTLAQGSWSKALKLASDKTWEQRENLFHFFEKPQTELGPLLEWAALETKNFELLIDQLEQVLEDLIQWTLTAETHDNNYFWKNTDGQKALTAHAQAVTSKLGSKANARAFWLKNADRIFRARQELQTPLNKKILIQDVLMPWLEI